MTYKLVRIDFGTKVIENIIKIDGDVTLSIPFDPANTDYQAYLAWLAEGNEPLPAEEANGA